MGATLEKINNHGPFYVIDARVKGQTVRATEFMGEIILVLGFLMGIMTFNVHENVDNKTKREMCSRFFFSNVWLSVFVKWPYLDLHKEMFASSFCCH